MASETRLEGQPLCADLARPDRPTSVGWDVWIRIPNTPPGITPPDQELFELVCTASITPSTAAGLPSWVFPFIVSHASVAVLEPPAL
jgi:hypothetical protein